MWYKQILASFYTIIYSQVKQKKQKAAINRLLYVTEPFFPYPDTASYCSIFYRQIPNRLANSFSAPSVL